MPDSAHAIHDAQRMRDAGRDLLSLALIDARNRTLRWLAVFEPQLQGLQPVRDVHPPVWLVGHAAWFQEYWVARNVQRQRGEAMQASGTRLASIEPGFDALFDPSCHAAQQRWQLDWPEPATLRRYLADTLEATLDLLAAAAEDDASLYVYRLALRREDAIGEALAVAAQALQIPQPDSESPWLPRPARAQRDALLFGARSFALGSSRGGWVPANERWAHDERVLEFEIDAQVVTWAQFAEFAADGAYDDESLWSAKGWAWVQAVARRAPRYVEQMRQEVLVHRHGQVQRVAAAQAATHVSRYEAEAWCRWAGRRLPTELEWELAATTGVSRGFSSGDVFEWVAGSARGWPGYEAGLPGFTALPAAAGVLRGASWMTPRRALHSRARRFAEPQRDALFCGFRSCAL